MAPAVRRVKDALWPCDTKGFRVEREDYPGKMPECSLCQAKWNRKMLKQDIWQENPTGSLAYNRPDHLRHTPRPSNIVHGELNVSYLFLVMDLK